MSMIDHAGVLDTTADAAWRVLRRFGDIAEWHPAIAESRIEGDVPDGAPGCTRHLKLAGGGTIVERLLALDDANRSYTYRFLEAPLPVDDYHLTVALVPLTGDTRTFIRWTASFDVRPGHDPAEQIETVRGLVAGGHEALSQHLTSKAT